MAKQLAHTKPRSKPIEAKDPIALSAANAKALGRRLAELNGASGLSKTGSALAVEAARRLEKSGALSLFDLKTLLRDSAATVERSLAEHAHSGRARKIGDGADEWAPKILKFAIRDGNDGDEAIALGVEALFAHAEKLAIPKGPPSLSEVTKEFSEGAEYDELTQAFKKALSVSDWPRLEVFWQGLLVISAKPDSEIHENDFAKVRSMFGKGNKKGPIPFDPQPPKELKDRFFDYLERFERTICLNVLDRTSVWFKGGLEDVETVNFDPTILRMEGLARSLPKGGMPMRSFDATASALSSLLANSWVAKSPKNAHTLRTAQYIMKVLKADLCQPDPSKEVDWEE